MEYEKIVAYVKKKAAKVDASKIGSAAIQVDITGEGEGAFYIAVKEGKVEVEPYEYIDHDAKVIATADDFLAVIDGKLDPIAAYMDGKIRIEGSVEKAAVLKDVVKLAAPAKKEAPAKKAEPAKKAAPAKKPAAKKAAPAKKEEPKKEEVKKEEPKKEEVKKAEPAKKAAPAKKPAAKKAAPAKKK